MTQPGPIATMTKFCHACGNKIDATANMCRYCGAMQPGVALTQPSNTEKRLLPAFLFWFFLGIFSAHRFYVGKVGTAILQIVTLGGLGIWVGLLVGLVVVSGGLLARWLLRERLELLRAQPA